MRLQVPPSNSSNSCSSRSLSGTSSSGSSSWPQQQQQQQQQQLLQQQSSTRSSVTSFLPPGRNNNNSSFSTFGGGGTMVPMGTTSTQQTTAANAAVHYQLQQQPERSVGIKFNARTILSKSPFPVELPSKRTTQSNKDVHGLSSSSCLDEKVITQQKGHDEGLMMGHISNSKKLQMFVVQERLDCFDRQKYLIPCPPRALGHFYPEDAYVVVYTIMPKKSSKRNICDSLKKDKKMNIGSGTMIYVWIGHQCRTLTPAEAHDSSLVKKMFASCHYTTDDGDHNYSPLQLNIQHAKVYAIVPQGMEPNHFYAMFSLTHISTALVVHGNGSVLNDEWLTKPNGNIGSFHSAHPTSHSSSSGSSDKTFLYRVHAVDLEGRNGTIMSHAAYAAPIPCEASALDTRYCYINATRGIRYSMSPKGLFIVQPQGTAIVWNGKHSTEYERRVSLVLALKLVEGVQEYVTVLEEGEENDEFWDSFIDGMNGYSPEAKLPPLGEPPVRNAYQEYNQRPPVLYMSHGTDQLKWNRVGTKFTWRDLNDSAMMILDDSSSQGVFFWVGAKLDEEEFKPLKRARDIIAALGSLRTERFDMSREISPSSRHGPQTGTSDNSTTTTMTSPSKIKFRGLATVIVRSGHEPQMFKRHFPPEEEENHGNKNHEGDDGSTTSAVSWGTRSVGHADDGDSMTSIPNDEDKQDTTTKPSSFINVDSHNNNLSTEQVTVAPPPVKNDVPASSRFSYYTSTPITEDGQGDDDADDHEEQQDDGDELGPISVNRNDDENDNPYAMYDIIESFSGDDEIGRCGKGTEIHLTMHTTSYKEGKEDQTTEEAAPTPAEDESPQSQKQGLDDSSVTNEAVPNIKHDYEDDFCNSSRNTEIVSRAGTTTIPIMGHKKQGHDSVPPPLSKACKRNDTGSVISEATNGSLQSRSSLLQAARKNRILLASRRQSEEEEVSLIQERRSHTSYAYPTSRHDGGEMSVCSGSVVVKKDNALMSVQSAGSYHKKGSRDDGSTTCNAKMEEGLSTKRADFSTPVRSNRNLLASFPAEPQEVPDSQVSRDVNVFVPPELQEGAAKPPTPVQSSTSSTDQQQPSGEIRCSKRRGRSDAPVEPDKYSTPDEVKKSNLRWQERDDNAGDKYDNVDEKHDMHQKKITNKTKSPTSVVTTSHELACRASRPPPMDEIIIADPTNAEDGEEIEVLFNPKMYCNPSVTEDEEEYDDDGPSTTLDVDVPRTPNVVRVVDAKRSSTILGDEDVDHDCHNKENKKNCSIPVFDPTPSWDSTTRTNPLVVATTPATKHAVDRNLSIDESECEMSDITCDVASEIVKLRTTRNHLIAKLRSEKFQSKIESQKAERRTLKDLQKAQNVSKKHNIKGPPVESPVDPPKAPHEVRSEETKAHYAEEKITKAESVMEDEEKQIDAARTYDDDEKQSNGATRSVSENDTKQQRKVVRISSERILMTISTSESFPFDEPSYDSSSYDDDDDDDESSRATADFSNASTMLEDKRGNDVSKSFDDSSVYTGLRSEKDVDTVYSKFADDDSTKEQQRWNCLVGFMQPSTTPDPPSETPTSILAPALKPSSFVAPAEQPASTITPAVLPTSIVAPAVQPAATGAPAMPPTSIVASAMKPTPTAEPPSLEVPAVQPPSEEAPAVHPRSKDFEAAQSPSEEVPAAQPSSTVVPAVQPTSKIVPLKESDGTSESSAASLLKGTGISKLESFLSKDEFEQSNEPIVRSDSKASLQTAQTEGVEVANEDAKKMSEDVENVTEDVEVVIAGDVEILPDQQDNNRTLLQYEKCPLSDPIKLEHVSSLEAAKIKAEGGKDTSWDTMKHLIQSAELQKKISATIQLQCFVRICNAKKCASMLRSEQIKASFETDQAALLITTFIKESISKKNPKQKKQELQEAERLDHGQEEDRQQVLAEQEHREHDQEEYEFNEKVQGQKEETQNEDALEENYEGKGQEEEETQYEEALEANEGQGEEEETQNGEALEKNEEEQKQEVEAQTEEALEEEGNEQGHEAPEEEELSFEERMEQIRKKTAEDNARRREAMEKDAERERIRREHMLKEQQARYMLEQELLRQQEAERQRLEDEKRLKEEERKFREMAELARIDQLYQPVEELESLLIEQEEEIFLKQREREKNKQRLAMSKIIVQKCQDGTYIPSGLKPSKSDVTESHQLRRTLQMSHYRDAKLTSQSFEVELQPSFAEETLLAQAKNSTCEDGGDVESTVPKKVNMLLCRKDQIESSYSSASCLKTDHEEEEQSDLSVLDELDRYQESSMKIDLMDVAPEEVLNTIMHEEVNSSLDQKTIFDLAQDQMNVLLNVYSEDNSECNEPEKAIPRVSEPYSFAHHEDVAEDFTQTEPSANDECSEDEDQAENRVIVHETAEAYPAELIRPSETDPDASHSLAQDQSNVLLKACSEENSECNGPENIVPEVSESSSLAHNEVALEDFTEKVPSANAECLVVEGQTDNQVIVGETTETHSDDAIQPSQIGPGASCSSLPPKDVTSTESEKPAIHPSEAVQVVCCEPAEMDMSNKVQSLSATPAEKKVQTENHVPNGTSGEETCSKATILNESENQELQASESAPTASCKVIEKDSPKELSSPSIIPKVTKSRAADSWRNTSSNRQLWAQKKVEAMFQSDKRTEDEEVNSSQSALTKSPISTHCKDNIAPPIRVPETNSLTSASPKGSAKPRFSAIDNDSSSLKSNVSVKHEDKENNFASVSMQPSETGPAPQPSEPVQAVCCEPVEIELSNKVQSLNGKPAAKRVETENHGPNGTTSEVQASESAPTACYKVAKKDSPKELPSASVIPKVTKTGTADTWRNTSKNRQLWAQKRLEAMFQSEKRIEDQTLDSSKSVVTKSPIPTTCKEANTDIRSSSSPPIRVPETNFSTSGNPTESAKPRFPAKIEIDSSSMKSNASTLQDDKERNFSSVSTKAKLFPKPSLYLPDKPKSRDPSASSNFPLVRRNETKSKGEKTSSPKPDESLKTSPLISDSPNKSVASRTNQFRASSPKPQESQKAERVLLDSPAGSVKSRTSAVATGTSKVAQKLPRAARKPSPLIQARKAFFQKEPEIPQEPEEEKKDVVLEEEQEEEEQETFYTLAELIDGVEGIDYGTREQMLSPKDFQDLFSTTKEEFLKLPKWKQAQKKKNVGLF